MTTSNSLELLTVEIAQKRLDLDEPMFMFAAGALRGKVVSIRLADCVPSRTYQRGTATTSEPCVVIEFIPGPKDRQRVKDPLKFKFTRQSQVFVMPVRAVPKGFFLRKFADGAWLLNIVTSFKGDPVNKGDDQE